jgi:hypothetical protein
VDNWRDFWPNWEQLVDDAEANQRATAGLDPDNPALVELVGKLSTQSEEFRRLWGSHNVRKGASPAGRKRSGTRWSEPSRSPTNRMPMLSSRTAVAAAVLSDR